MPGHVGDKFGIDRNTLDIKRLLHIEQPADQLVAVLGTRHPSDDGAPQLARRREYAVEAGEVDTRRRNQGREAAQERDRLEGHVGVAGVPAAPEPIAHLAGAGAGAAAMSAGASTLRAE